MTKSKAQASLFDPADQEIGPELVNELKTDESMYTPDTNGDPVGSEERSMQEPRKLPDFYFAKYALDADGAPMFQQSRVDGIMKVFNAKKDTEMQFNNPDEEQAKKEREYFETQVRTVADGFMPLLEVDPQSTGINLLQLTTRTWAEFSAICYEYKEEADKVAAQDELPTWLIEREDKMFNLGRKARMLSAVVADIGESFGLSDLSLKTSRVQTEVERRQQRLAEWNYRQHADNSVYVANTLNQATATHTQDMFANA